MTVDRQTGEITDTDGHLVNTLEELETTIEQGLHTFVEVGNALATIRDLKMYRDSHDTFEAYCSERWNLTRKRAYDLMGAAEIVSAMSPMGDTPLPTSERQARELAPLREVPQVALDIYADVQRRSNGRPTAALVREAVKRHLASVPEQPKVQDEEFWNEAAEKLTESGWVAKRDAERPYSLAFVRLERIARDVASIDITPDLLGANVPDHSLDALPQIEAAAAWLNTFLSSRKESA